MRTGRVLAILFITLGVLVGMVKPGKAVPVGTKFTYQGRLIDANNAADGLYDFQFRLFDVPNAGSQQGDTIDINDLDVFDGYFKVELDFGSDVFNGDARWLQISVMPGDSMGRMTVLSPRQEVTPTPYALQTRGIFVDSSGSIGIGTADPKARLHVSGGSILLDNSYGLFSMDSSFFLRRLLYLNDMDNLVITNYAGGNIFLGTYTSPGAVLTRITVTPAGNVGIGTTNPACKLDVEGTVQAQAYDTGDIFFRKEGERLWRMFEDEKALYLENLRTSKVYTFVLQAIQEENETKRAVDFEVVIDGLKAENESLKKRIENLETIVQQLVRGREFEL
jgi:hypothetical protein